MTTHNQRSFFLLATGLVLIPAGWALGSGLFSMLGVLCIALIVRYRSNAAPWEYLCFVALSAALLAWELHGSLGTSSPLLGVLPLLLSFVLDYLDKQRQKRGAAAAGTVTEQARQPHQQP